LIIALVSTFEFRISCFHLSLFRISDFDIPIFLTLGAFASLRENILI